MRKNVQITLTGFWTLAVGIYLAIQQHYLRDDPNDRIIHIMAQLGDIYWAVALITIGTIAITIGLTHYNRHHAYSIMTVVLSALWCAYFFALLLQDLHFGGTVKLGAMLVGAEFISILVDARFGNGGGGRNGTDHHRGN